jgi:hypothetical protein
MRTPRRLLCSLVLSCLACGPDSGSGAGGTRTAEPISVSGMWEVAGTTVEQGGEHARKIEGTVILAQEGSRYTSTFTMQTMLPTPDGASLETEVIGKGEGTIEGRAIHGTAHTQLVISTVPGVSPGFAYVPRTVTTRIVSNVQGELLEDDTLSLLIENAPDVGEEYTPTRTTLRGMRVSPAEAGGAGSP